MRRLIILCALAVVVATSSRPVGCAEPPAVDRLLTNSTALYGEFSRPQELIDLVLSDKARQLADQFPAVAKYWESKDFRTLKTVVEVLERRLGVEWRTAIETLTAGGVTAAFDTSEQAAFLFVRSGDAELLAKLHDALVEMTEADAENKGRESPIKSEDYRGFTGWTFGKNEAHVLLGDLLVVSNKAEALKGVADRYLAAAENDAKESDEKSASLADDAVYRAARKHAAGNEAGFAFVRLAPLRLLAGMAKALGQKSNNALLELLLGGALDAVSQADYLAATLQLNEQGLRFAAHLPRDRAKVAPTRTWFFADKPNQSAEIALDVPGTIATLTAHRDVGGMWQARSDLFDEQTNVGFTKADTNLGLYFSGKDFGSQVLGELEPKWRIIAAERKFGVDGEPTPALKLPSFAVVWELKHPLEFAPHLQLAFQNVVGLTNVDGAQKGRAQLLLKSEQRGDAEIHYGTYLRVGETDQDNAPVQFNFRPACARVGKHFIVGSHVDLVRTLADQLGKQPSTPTTSDSFALEIRAQELATILAANRPLIVGRRMLAAGGDKPAAEGQLELGLEALRLFEDAGIRLIDGADSLTLELRLQTASN